MPAAATWPKGAKLARIISLSIWHLNPLAKLSAVVLGCLWIRHVVRLLIAWEGAASSGHHFTLTPVWFGGMCTHAEQDPCTNLPRDPEHLLHLLLKGVFSSEPLCCLFFFSPLSPSSSPSRICVQPLEGPTSCHYTCVGGFLCEQRIQNIAFLYIMKSHILLCSYKTISLLLRLFLLVTF